MLPYEHDPLQLRLAMKVAGEHRFEAIDAHHWQKLAADLSVDGDELIDRAHRMAVALPDALSEEYAAVVSERPGIRPPTHMLDAVTDWSRRCRRSLDRLRARS